MGWTLVENELLAVLGERTESGTFYRGSLRQRGWVCHHEHPLPMQAERCAKVQAAVWLETVPAA
jgi:hypothetical protein